MGDSDCLPPVWHRSGCPRSTIPPQRPQPSLQQQEDAPTTGPDCGSAVARTVYFLGGDDRPSQVPGGPQCAHAPLSDPGGHTTPGLYSAALLPSGLQTPSAPTMSRISGLNHAAWTLAVYASPQQLPTAAQDSLPAGGQPLPGGLNGPLGPSRNFMAASMPPIPSDQASPGAPEGPPYGPPYVRRPSYFSFFTRSWGLMTSVRRMPKRSLTTTTSPWAMSVPFTRTSSGSPARRSSSTTEPWLSCSR